MIGRSVAICVARAMTQEMAAFDAPVLLEGEIGIGKGLAARAIHVGEARREGSYARRRTLRVAAAICAALVFLALAPASRAGEIYGTVTLNGTRVDGGTLVISRHDEGRVLVRVAVRSSGDYSIYLAPGHYDARLAGARAPILMRSFPARVRQDLKFSR